MANLSPLTSQSPSKENDSIDEGSAQRRAVKQRDDDDFEDSLNVSISEHISEEIESGVEDSIEKSAPLFDKSAAEKKRKLFDFGDSDKSEAVDSDGVRQFTKFDVANLLDESLSGDNIAKHFLVETETGTQRSSVNEPIASVSQRTKNDNSKIDDVNEGAASSSKTNVETSSRDADEMQKTKGNSNSDELMHVGDSHKSSGEGNRNSDERHDVILINDHEISIHSLKELQRQRSRSDIEPKESNQTQNTTSDISDLQNEDNAKEQRSIEDLSGISINESSSKVESHSAVEERSKSSTEKVSRTETDGKLEKSEEIADNGETIQKCTPMEDTHESLPELSVIEEVSAADELSSRRNLIESLSDKKIEMKKIIEETVSKLPLDKENRPPNLNDDLLSVGSKQLTSSQSSNITDGTVYNNFAKSHLNMSEANFDDELNLNLIHMENKIKELRNMNVGKYSATFFDISMLSASRRSSLKDSIRDFPQSGRESNSINTNSTEYQPFQDEYFRVNMI